MNITELSAAELSEAIHGRDVSCREVMTAYLDHIDERNPAVNAIVSRRDRDELLAEANECDDEIANDLSRGWMHGMPQAIKDLAAAKGLPMTMGSRLLEHFVPDFDSADGGAHEGRRLHRDRQDQRARVRPRLAHVQRRVRRDAQPVRPHPNCRWQQWWSSRGAGHPHAAGGRRQRLHGLAAQPGGVEQRLRLSAQSGPCAWRTRTRRLPRPVVHRGSDGSHGARRRHAARDAGRLPRRFALVAHLVGSRSSQLLPRHAPP